MVGFLASLAAVAMGWVPEGHFDSNHAFLLCASSILTASSASFMLGQLYFMQFLILIFIYCIQFAHSNKLNCISIGLIMVAVIVLSRRLNINPDNVATPIAASLGDLTTLALLSYLSSYLYKRIGT